MAKLGIRRFLIQSKGCDFYSVGYGVIASDYFQMHNDTKIRELCSSFTFREFDWNPTDHFKNTDIRLANVCQHPSHHRPPKSRFIWGPKMFEVESKIITHF